MYIIKTIYELCNHFKNHIYVCCSLLIYNHMGEINKNMITINRVTNPI